MPITNTLAYYEHSQITAAKIFVTSWMKTRDSLKTNAFWANVVAPSFFISQVQVIILSFLVSRVLS
jgi:hypothetical protein